jgi:hypothetical protein
MTRVYQRRKVAPKVRDGAVQKKNNHRPTATLGYVLARESPARGYRHMVTKQDIRLLTSIIPGWDEISDGIESVILTAGSQSYDGRYELFQREKTGSIQIPAWHGELWTVFAVEYFREHADVFERLGVVSETHPNGIECRFTAPQLKGFLLLHVFLHELGHHVDRMTSKAQLVSRRGESFAETYANELCSIIWPAYLRVFGDPRR